MRYCCALGRTSDVNRSAVIAAVGGCELPAVGASRRYHGPGGVHRFYGECASVRTSQERGESSAERLIGRVVALNGNGACGDRSSFDVDASRASRAGRTRRAADAGVTFGPLRTAWPL